MKIKKIIFTALMVFTFSFFCEASEKLHPLYTLEITFDVENKLLRGLARITFPEGLTTPVSLGNLSLISIEMNKKPIPLPPQEKIQAQGALVISYEARFKQTKMEDPHYNPGVITENVINKQGICLTEIWHPMLEIPAEYHLRALVPENFTALSEADRTTETKVRAGIEYTFDFPYLRNNITFIASKYEVSKEIFNNIEVFAYFFPEDISLAKTYIDHSKKYLAMYQKMFGPYPYKRFSVVENFLPTGYSLPTFTLLGQTVVRLPFIATTSLGHEILHQWFGNYVYTDYENGNWNEGLTSYLSDHLYDEKKGDGRKHRKKLLLDYRNYVNTQNETPLDAFHQRTGAATRAIGYGKGALFFHMLKNQVGEEIFYKALRKLIEENRFTRTSWDGILKSFESTSDADLEWFFDQWLSRKGLPQIEITDKQVLMLGEKYTVSFRAIQHGPVYKLSLPVRITTDNKDITKTFTLEKKSQYFEFIVPENPLQLIIDGDYDIFRKLSEDECPPVISGLLGDPQRKVVFSENQKEKSKDAISFLETRGFTPVNEKDIKDSDIASSSLLLLDSKGPVYRRLFGRAETFPDMGVSLNTYTNPLNHSKVITVLSGKTEQGIKDVVKKMFHYGKYSHLRFQDKKNVFKETAASSNGIKISLHTPVMGIKSEKTISLETIIENIKKTPVIYVGETHDLYEDHKVQLDVIRMLHEENPNLAIGMEMFTQSKQQALDDYLSGTINEKDFLKASDYFKDWKFNYHLYREILYFAKEKQIPVIALNLKRELIKKVARNGLDNLTTDEKKKIPGDMDMSDIEYKKRLQKTFSRHDKARGINFENFYQSQILWDETMAHSIDRFLRQNPKRQIVVIAGAGHIAYGSGIPKRTYRLNGKEYVTLLNAKSGSPRKGFADYVLFPEPLSTPAAPLLGIFITKEDKGIMIEGFSPGSVAQKAGIKKEDYLLSIDGMKIIDIVDPKIALFSKKKEETIPVKILRKRFMLPDREITFKVKLR